MGRSAKIEGFSMDREYSHARRKSSWEECFTEPDIKVIFKIIQKENEDYIQSNNFSGFSLLEIGSDEEKNEVQLVISAMKLKGYELSFDMAQCLWEDYCDESVSANWLGVPDNYETIICCIEDLCAMRVYEEIRNLEPIPQPTEGVFAFERSKRPTKEVLHNGKLEKIGIVMEDLAPNNPSTQVN